MGIRDGAQTSQPHAAPDAPLNVGRAVVGLVLVAAGVAFLVAGGGIGGIVSRGWPLAIVALGALQLYSDRRVTPTGVGIVLVGAVLLGATTGALGGLGDLVAPALLVGLGVSVALGWRRRGEPIPAGDRVGALAAFGSRRVVTASERFEGGWASAFFGQLDLDLSAAAPVADGAELSVTVAFGGADVVVPDGWAVRIRGLPLLGGWDDTTRRVSPGAGVPELRVNALAAFGGVEVKHRDRWA